MMQSTKLDMQEEEVDPTTMLLLGLCDRRGQEHSKRIYEG